jgi:hypothetical protein
LTPEQHNKYLGILHLAHGGLTSLFMLAMGIFMSIASAVDPRGGPPPEFVGLMWAFLLVFGGIMVAPSYVAGYGLLKRRRWAKVAAIVSAVMSASSAPIGTAVCAYTFWFLFSESGKLLYDQPQYALPPRSANWQFNQSREQSRDREVQYTPPPSPPDWR